jgi:hypothetical protein
VGSAGATSSGEESETGCGGFDLAKLKAMSGKRRTAGATTDASKGKPAVAAAAAPKKKLVGAERCYACLLQKEVRKHAGGGVRVERATGRAFVEAAWCCCCGVAWASWVFDRGRHCRTVCVWRMREPVHVACLAVWPSCSIAVQSS